MSTEGRLYSLLVDPRFGNHDHLRALAIGIAAEETRLKPHAEPPTETDEQASIAHYVDHGTNNAKHSLAHIDRLGDEEVQNDPKAVSWHFEHAHTHGEESLDAWEAVDDFLSKYPSNPSAYRAAKAKLDHPAEDSGSGSEDEEKSAPRWHLP